VQQIFFWMTANLLILNSSKTEFLLIGRNNNSLKYTTHLSLQPTPLATLALSLANTLPSLDQIAALSKTWYYHVRELRCIRPYLDFKTASTIATSIVHYKLDYSNSLYHNLSNCQLNRFQQIQNSVARAVN